MRQVTHHTYKARKLVAKPVVKCQLLQQTEELVMIKLAGTGVYELIKTVLASFVGIYDHNTEHILVLLFLSSLPGKLKVNG